MNNSLQDSNLLLKAEADEILSEKGLLGILSSFGIPHVAGSYALGLMAWRDLDIYLQVGNFSEADFFVLGSKICTVFNPVKMSFRNELVAKIQGLPTGLYWGIYLGNEKAGAWKIDIWAVVASECKRLIQPCTDIKQKLTPEATEKILAIKLVSWRDPEYRRSYISTDIYDAVLQKDVNNIEEFRTYLRRKNARQP